MNKVHSEKMKAGGKTEPALTADPMFGEWTASTLEVRRIRAALDQLWIDWTDRYVGSPSEATSDRQDQAYMRPSTINAIAIADSDEEATRMATTLATLQEYSPSRSIVLSRNSAGNGEDRCSVRIEVAERRATRSSAPIRIEVITLMAPSGNDDMLASMANSLLLPDLPEVLVVLGEPLANNGLVASLIERTDGLLVDTVSTQRVGETLDYLLRASQLKNRLGVGDLVWTRLRTWRDLLAQFFDQPAARGELDRIDDVRIIYAPRNEVDRSGLTAALLTAGWLGSRLGWRAPGDLIPSNAGYRLTLRAGDRGKSREVLLSLEEGRSKLLCSSLESVRLASKGGDPSEFLVERRDEAAITTLSSTAEMAHMTRLVHSSCPADGTILAAKLRRLRYDTVYLEALELASVLWPPGFES